MEDITPNLQDVEKVKNKAFDENKYTKDACLDLPLQDKA